MQSRKLTKLIFIYLCMVFLLLRIRSRHSWQSIKYRLSRKNQKRHPLFTFLYGKYLNFRWFFGDDRYTDANPFKRLYVDPSDIEYAVDERKEKWGRVNNEGWNSVPFDERTRYETLERHFVEEVPWEKLPLDNERGCTKDQLYERMVVEGYTNQRELHPVWNPFRKRDFEIGVVIDADGEIKWTGYGQHRLIIAKLLDIDEVPVQVHVRHREWQNVRDELRAAESIDDLSEKTRRVYDHPDLADLRSNIEIDNP